MYGNPEASFDSGGWEVGRSGQHPSCTVKKPKTSALRVRFDASGIPDKSPFFYMRAMDITRQSDNPSTNVEDPAVDKWRSPE